MGERTENLEPSGRVVPFDQAPKDLEAIAAGAARGDSASVLLLYDRFGPIVNRLVWRLMGADSEHNDIVHDVFVNVLKSIGQVRTPALLEQWICGITVHIVRGEIRRRRLYRFLHLDPDAGEQFAIPSDPDAHMALRRFYEVLDGMPANDRIIFTLRFVDGRRLSEIGPICSCSLAAVKRRLRRARAEFFRQAGDELFSPLLGKGYDDD